MSHSDKTHGQSNKQRLCKFCDNILTGRSDQKFCSAYCKTEYHNAENRGKIEPSLYQNIDAQIKKNRKILQKFNYAGYSVAYSAELENAGFSPFYYTHTWKNKKGTVYFFVYEYGFAFGNTKDKYVLIKWQDYMQPSQLRANQNK